MLIIGSKLLGALVLLFGGFTRTPAPLVPPVGRTALVPWSGSCSMTATYRVNGVPLTFTATVPGVSVCTFYVPNIPHTRRFVSYAW